MEGQFAPLKFHVALPHTHTRTYTYTYTYTYSYTYTYTYTCIPYFTEKVRVLVIINDHPLSLLTKRESTVQRKMNESQKTQLYNWLLS